MDRKYIRDQRKSDGTRGSSQTDDIDCNNRATTPASKRSGSAVYKRSAAAASKRTAAAASKRTATSSSSRPAKRQHLDLIEVQINHADNIPKCNEVSINESCI